MIFIDILYLLAAVVFILGIKRLTKVKTAKEGNLLAALAMFIAVGTTLVKMYYGDPAAGIEAGKIGWGYIIAGVVIGGAFGLVMARIVKMTAMPELVAIFNGFGGGASTLVAFSYYMGRSSILFFDMVTIVLSMIIGTVTFTGSIIAFLKLRGLISSRPIRFPGSQFINVILFLGMIGLGVRIAILSDPGLILILALSMILTAAVLGILLVTPIGGADMPVVISLLNSYSGLAAAMTGFVLKNNLLIISGALVGASGIILTKIMCKAMNRSLANVLFGGFGQVQAASKSEGYKNIKESSPEEAALLLESVGSVIFVPGYGLAVAQAQYAVQELAEMLIKRGIKVSYGIHPVAGRMPGHMNVLLAEANVPYEQLFDLEQINPEFKNTDVAIIVGANDVVNPAATNNNGSPIYGMPILKVYEAKSVLVVKRSLSPGFAGIDNELFDYDNTRMLFGDAKQIMQQLIQEVEEL